MQSLLPLGVVLWRGHERGHAHEQPVVVGDSGQGVPPGQGSLQGHVRPVEGRSAQQHVPDQGLDRGLAHQTDEEQLLDDLRKSNVLKFLHWVDKDCMVKN